MVENREPSKAKQSRAERRVEKRREEMVERVCVTGAGGFVASWVVNYLLSKDYIVHGTVRDPSDAKNAHLKKLEKAKENLQLFKADLRDYNGLRAAIAGCSGVFHVASPVPSGRVSNPEVEVVELAKIGMRNILRACTEAKVKRVVVVSSFVAVILNPNWPKGKAMDESCWSDKQLCRRTQNWYFLAKTEAESEALEYANRTGLSVVTLCPSLIVGPMLQSKMNSSSMTLVQLLRDGSESTLNFVRMLVDVRDLAEALLLAYENPEADGRYLCSGPSVKKQDLVNKLKSVYPKYRVPKKITEESGQDVSCEKLQKLGWKCRPLEETLADSVQNFKEKGILD